MIATFFLCMILPLVRFECFAQQKKQQQLQKPASVQPRGITFEQLDQLLALDASGMNDTIRVVNFWATTCPPCIGELPAFDKVQREFGMASLGMRPVRVYLVSLDFVRDMKPKVIPFLKKRAFAATALLLGPPSSTQIDRVDKAWSGAMPATIIIGAGKRLFFEQAFTFDELSTILQPLRTIQL
jgi:thiol-disulfide isomerase/thioredoxin